MVSVSRVQIKLAFSYSKISKYMHLLLQRSAIYVNSRIDERIAARKLISVYEIWRKLLQQ